jgi:hypothetical protein
MKKRTIGDLLKKLDESRITNDESITNLNDAMSKKMLKGGYDTYNGNCSGSNSSCDNLSCAGTTNTSCNNTFCLV